MKAHEYQQSLDRVYYALFSVAFAMNLQIAFKQYNITLDTKTLMLYNLN